MDLSFLLPPELNWPIAIALLCASYFCSLITAAISLGGGVLMISLLASIFPPVVLIPLHGAIQIGSNSGRAVAQRAHIQWHVVLWLGLGMALGSAIGVNFATILPEDIFQIVIGLFILIVTWLPEPKIEGRGRGSLFAGGAILAFLGMIVGVIGPMVMTFIRYMPDRHQLVGTHAAIMTLYGVVRFIAFALVGFAFAKYLPFIAAMIATGILGAFTGSLFLHRLPENIFRWILKLLISALALNVLQSAIFS